MMSLERFFVLGCLSLLVGVSVNAFNLDYEHADELNGFLLLQNITFTLAFLFGFGQLIIHLKSLFKLKSKSLMYKVIFTWIALSFSLISGYVLSLVCFIKKSSTIGELIEDR